MTHPLIIASDGSVQDHRASYGWIIATQEGTRLVQCKGPAYGYRITSFRAEGYGILSAIRFIHLCNKIWDVSSQYTIICDNEAMVEILQEKLRVEDTYVNQTLKAEWDIIAEIRATIDEDRIWEAVHFRHIKGHADKTTPYQQLTHMQKLNVDADSLADEYIQQNRDIDYSIVPILPTSGAQLNMPGGTVTYRLKQTVMQARSQRDHQQYLCCKNNWTIEDFENIDWESHRQALNHYPTRRTILTKYLHNMAPVGKLVNRYDPKYPAGCPSCLTAQETHEHMLKCPCTKRAEWRDKFLTAIKGILEDYGTPLPTQQLMMAGLRHTLGLQDTLPTNIPLHMVPIATAQEAIGWSQMMQGRLAKGWKHQQLEAMQGNTTKYKNAQTWSTALVRTIFQHWLELWTIRNNDRHGRDWQSKRIATKEQVMREITQLYEYKGMIMPHHEWIFHTTLEQQQQKSTYVLRAFVNNYKPVILASYQTCLETG
jgi:Reverse transcriptase-like